MRISQLLSQTRRELPADVEGEGLRLLVQAGFVQPLGGQFGLLPLGERTLVRLAQRLGAAPSLPAPQEISLPPGDHPLLALADLLRSHLRSYRQFPILLSQQGLAIAGRRQHRIRDWFGLHASRESLDAQAQTLRDETGRLLGDCGLSNQVIESDPGAAGGAAWEWLALLPDGDALMLGCQHCGYAASQEMARFARQDPPAEEARPLQKVATPHCSTIADLANLLQVPQSRTAKAVFLTATLPDGQEKLLFAVTRGERDVSEARLRQVSGARALRPADEASIRACGATPGYASPVGLKDAWVVVERDIPLSPNLVAGANSEGYHLLNVNYGRDYTAQQVGEFALARPGDPCPGCGGPLSQGRGTVVASLQQPGAALAIRAGCNFRDENGQNQPALINGFRLNLERLMLTVAELNRDEKGLRWPTAAAPYDLHLVLLASKSGQAETVAEDLYRQLCQAGLEPLFDDRSESAGVKFNDADLIGLPLRLTASERALRQGGIEFKSRSGGEAWVVGFDQVLAQIRARIGILG